MQTKTLKKEMVNSIDLAFINAINIVRNLSEGENELPVINVKRANQMCNNMTGFYTLEFLPAGQNATVKIKNHTAFYFLPANIETLTEMHKAVSKSWSKMKVSDQKELKQIQKPVQKVIEKSVTFDISKILTKIINQTEDEMKKDLTNVTLQIKQKEFDLIKAGTKKIDWRSPSKYNKDRLFVPSTDPTKKGLLDGNEALKTITFIVGQKTDSPKMIVEIAERIKMIKFQRDVEEPENNFRALKGQSAIQIKLGKILSI